MMASPKDPAAGAKRSRTLRYDDGATQFRLRLAGWRGEKPEVAPSRRVVHARREERPGRRRWFKGL